MPLLSVVIPVYNVEHTLKRCVESVLAQRVADMQVILVDDGSTDASPLLADTYRGLPGVVVVHKANGGLSDARNVGLLHASGRYVAFVDSDDWLLPDTYAPLLDLLARHADYDVVEFSVLRDTPGETQALSLPDREFTDWTDYWVSSCGYAHAYAWNKIFRRSILGSAPFARGRLFEDVWLMGDVLPRVRCLRTTARGSYRYTYNPQGITVGAGAQAWRDLLLGHLRILDAHRLMAISGFGGYYAQLLNIQLSTFDLSDDVADILLPVLPFRRSVKLILLHLLGMRRLCRWHRWLVRLLH